MEDRRNYIVPSAIIGGTLGGVYKFINPSAKTSQNLASFSKRLPDIYKGYKHSFSLDKAANALKENTLTSDEYSKVEKITSCLDEAIKKEKAFNKIMSTPLEQRKIPSKDALKETKKAHAALRKEFWTFTKDLQNKLIELGVFNKDKFSRTYAYARKRLLSMFKELSMGSLKGLAVGVPAGALIGVGLNKIAHGEK